MTTEKQQKWLCPKCNGKDRTALDCTTKVGCWRCGTLMKKDGMVTITKFRGLILP